MQHDFQRIAIVNRGEAAMRFIHAAREFNQEYGTSLRTIALFTDPDRHAMIQIPIPQSAVMSIMGDSNAP
jgi:acetyl/propionyl-CoA carboxylase alpha subunit